MISISTDLSFLDVDGVLVGYGRVVTDRATFAWLCDVYVDPSRRGSGIGTAFLDAVTAELAGLKVKRVVLATEDALCALRLRAAGRARHVDVPQLLAPLIAH